MWCWLSPRRGEAKNLKISHAHLNQALLRMHEAAPIFFQKGVDPATAAIQAGVWWLWSGASARKRRS